MPLLFTETDIRQTIPFPAFQKGKAYWLSGQVETLQFEQINTNQQRILAKVKSTKAGFYQVEILVARKKGQVSFEPQCSCALGYQCKHVVAVLLHSLAHGDQTPKKAPSRASNKKSSHQTVNPALSNWLGQLEQERLLLDANAYPSKLRQRLVYILNLSENEEEHKACLQLRLISVRRLKQGGYGQSQRFNSLQAGYIRPIDHLILASLAPFRLDETQIDRYQLEGAAIPALLQNLSQTGRCYWESHHQTLLRWGEERPATIQWQIEPDGKQSLSYELSPAVDSILPTTPPCYIDLNSQSCGHISTPFPDEMATALLQAPAIAPHEIDTVQQYFQKHQIGLPSPLNLTVAKTIESTPLFHLRLFKLALDVPESQAWRYEDDHIELPCAVLSFQYRNTPLLPAGNNSPILHHYDLTSQQLIKIKRDLKQEKLAGQTLHNKNWQILAKHPLTKHLKLPKSLQHNYLIETLNWPLDKKVEQRLLDFSLYEIPKLREEGWHIDIDDDYPYQTVEAEELEDWYIQINEQEKQQDWFDLELGVYLGGKKRNLLPLLVDWLHTVEQQDILGHLESLPDEHRISLTLPDKRILPIPVQQIRHILTALTELMSKTPLNPSGQLQLFNLQANQLNEFEKSMQAGRLRWFGGDKLRLLGQRLQNFQGIELVDPPKGFKTELRGYQHFGISWLQFLRHYNLGGILADDMGLGKTIQALAHVLLEKEQGRLTQPCLVIAPTSLMYNWFMECKQFAPDLRVLILHGNERHQHHDNLSEYDLVLTTYSLLLRDKDALLAQHYHYLILDEAQNIKNPKAKATLLVQQLHARHRLCLTGTPMENHLGELWSLFNFLLPGLLGDLAKFQQLFRQPIEKNQDAQRQQILNQRIAPFMLRRTKEAVVTELPKKTTIIRSVPLEGGQRDLYETIRLSMHEKIQQLINQKGIAKNHIIILDALLKLRQICCDPRLLKLKAAEEVTESAKLNMLMELLPEMLEEGRRILLFSQFTSMLNLIEKAVKAKGIRYSKLTGQTRDRQKAIESFQNKEVPLFLISLKAGGTGLNLTAADTVIHYDPWWNPAVENQATDRVYRIGQDKPVFVYKLFAKHSIEEKIQDLQERKQQLADALFTQQNSQSFEATDLLALFEPL